MRLVFYTDAIWTAGMSKSFGKVALLHPMFKDGHTKLERWIDLIGSEDSFLEDELCSEMIVRILCVLFSCEE
jgi:hypothetical protein